MILDTKLYSYFYLIIAFYIIEFSLYFILRKSKIFLDVQYDKPQSLHKQSIPRLGGFLILIPFITIFYFFDKNFQNIEILIVCVSCFLIGFFDDLKLIQSARYRFFFFILLLFFFAITLNLNIKSFGIQYLNEINENRFFSIILFVACIFAVSNGANLIDGCNGLLLIHTIFCLIILAYVSYQENVNFIFNLNLFFIIILIPIFYLNFPIAKLFMGDSGAYLCGSLLGMSAVTLNHESNISPFFFGSLLIYLSYEIFFSIIRKLIEKKNPFRPDDMHLHMIIYRNIKNKKIKGPNYKTSIFVNTFNILLIIPIIFYYKNILLTKIFFVVYIIGYTFLYLYLRKNDRK